MGAAMEMHPESLSVWEIENDFIAALLTGRSAPTAAAPSAKTIGRNAFPQAFKYY
jgi:hypothetical protein